MNRMSFGKTLQSCQLLGLNYTFYLSNYWPIDRLTIASFYAYALVSWTPAWTTIMDILITLRGYYTPIQKLACFVLYLKIINTFLKIKYITVSYSKLSKNSKMALKLK